MNVSVSREVKSLKGILDTFYRTYDFSGRIHHDPIEFPHRYRRSEDIEVSGFISSCFAYGRVDLFKPVVARILSIMGESPYDFILGFTPRKEGRLFSGIKYRFNENADILCLIFVVRKVLSEYGTLEAVFQRHFSADDLNVSNGMEGLVKAFLKVDTSSLYGTDLRPEGFLQFFPSPHRGSACKRMNLFLRWMIRDRDIDFGIWKGVPKNKLIIPLDTHIARIAKCLGFTKRVSQDWKMAVEITGSLKQFDPVDPLKYDFALCHQGIAKLCNEHKCSECRFFAP